MDLKRFLFFTLTIGAVFFGINMMTVDAVNNIGLMGQDLAFAVSITAMDDPFSGNTGYENKTAFTSDAMFDVSAAGKDGLIKLSQDDGMRYIDLPQLDGADDYAIGGYKDPSTWDDGNRYIEPPWFLSNPNIDYLKLTQPKNGSTVSQKPVTFKWKYGENSDQWNMNIDFELSITVNTNGGTDIHVFNLKSSKCSKGVCSYKVNKELGSKNATVTWMVIGYLDNGDTIESEAYSFNLKLQNPSPTAVPPKPDGKPGVPVQKEPNATLYSRNVGFYWYPSSNAEYYTVNWWNDRGNSGSLRQNQTDSTCQLNLCIVKTTLPSEGNYSWTVTAANNKGTAASGTMSFRVAAQQIKAPNVYLPNGTVASQSNLFFEWENIESGVTEYRLQVVDKYSGVSRLDAWYSVNNIYRGGGICYIVPNVYLTTGTYSWRVKARAGTTESEWSSWLDFYLYDANYSTPAANTVPTPTYPTGTINELKPNYQWKAVTGAAYYQLIVYDSASTSVVNVTVPSSNCTSGTCSFTPNVSLQNNGSYRWMVSAYGANGSYWGYADASFNVGTITIQQQSIVFITPQNNGILDPNTHKIIWSDPGATVSSFRVEIQNAAGNTMLQADLTRANALCDGITCSIQFRTIPSGNGYQMFVTPYANGLATGKASTLTFSVQ